MQATIPQFDNILANNSTSNGITADGSTKLNEPVNTRQDCEDKCFTFEPQLYIQRYQYVSNLLKQYNCKTYLDIGCAECKLLRHARLFNTHLNMIIGIDLDEYLLMNSKFLVQPFSLEYIRKREQPLEIYIIKGDISKPPTQFLNKISFGSLDCVSLIEVIEHMYPDCLEKCIDTVFGYLQPKLIIMSTPNCEFNVVFNHGKSNNENEENCSRKKFRHWDHKFEWSRSEFQTWSNKIFDKYKHVYERCYFDGLGDPPAHFKSVGHCTQIVVFIKKSDYTETSHNLLIHNNQLQSYLNSLYKNPYDVTRQFFQSEDFHNPHTTQHGTKTFSDYKLIDCVQYPYQIIDLTNVNEKQTIIMQQVEWLLTFIIGRQFNQYDSDIELNESEIHECNENDICIEDLQSNHIKLVQLEHLSQYESLRKYKFTLDDIKEAVRSDGKYEMTKSGNYLILRSDAYSERRYSDSSLNEVDNIDCDDMEKPRNTGETTTTEMEVENWSDNEDIVVSNVSLNRSLYELKRRSLLLSEDNLQFVDAESNPSNSHYNLNQLLSSSRNDDLDWTKIENNYNFLETKSFAQKLFNIKRRNFDELKNLQYDSGQFDCLDD